MILMIEPRLLHLLALLFELVENILEVHVVLADHASCVFQDRVVQPQLFGNREGVGLAGNADEQVLDSVGKDFFCAMEKDKVVGFLYLKQTGKDTVELAVMGVLKEYHRKGIGRALFEYAKESIKESGYSFIQVKTVKMGMYKDYDCTNRFYISLGFKEFEVLYTLWDENNPCQIYVMAL